MNTEAYDRLHKLSRATQEAQEAATQAWVLHGTPETRAALEATRALSQALSDQIFEVIKNPIF